MKSIRVVRTRNLREPAELPWRIPSRPATLTKLILETPSYRPSKPMTLRRPSGTVVCFSVVVLWAAGVASGGRSVGCSRSSDRATVDEADPGRLVFRRPPAPRPVLHHVPQRTPQDRRPRPGWYQVDINHVGTNAELWEKVVRKLQSGQMPPVGRPRPVAEQIDTFVSTLETALDRAAAAAPNPGRPVAHRLNRTEYANAIRDLLALDVDGRVAAAGRRHRSARIRQQRRRPVDLAGAARALSVGGAQDQPPRGRPGALNAGDRHLHDSEAAGAGRSAEREAAVWIARRRRRFSTPSRWTANT